jgi:tetratricopeptide (TPR) repeat protein
VRSDADRALVEEIAHHPLIIGRNTALSYRAATICYYIQGFCAMANVDKVTAFQKFKRVKEILDNNPKIREDLPKRYMLTLSSMLRLQIDLGKIEESLELIKVMRKLTKEQAFCSEDITLRIFKSTYLAELKIYERRGEFEKALKIIPAIEEGLELNKTKINKEQELLFQNGIATVYFGAGMYKESLQWLNQVLNDNETNLRQDIYSYARLFNLVVHYELSNYDLLEYIIKSTYRYLSKRQRDHELEITIIEFMKRLARHGANPGTTEIFKEFKTELNEKLDTLQDQVLLDYFNYRIWIDSKINEIPFHEASRLYYREGVEA